MKLITSMKLSYKDSFFRGLYIFQVTSYAQKVLNNI